MFNYESSLAVPSRGDTVRLTAFAEDFLAAIETLGRPGEEAQFEAGRLFREAFIDLHNTATRPIPDGGVELLAMDSPSHAIVDVGYSLEEVLQTEGALTITFQRDSSELHAIVESGLPEYESIEFSAENDQTVEAENVAQAIAEFLPPNDGTRPSWNGRIFGGLTIGICKRHDRVRVASNAFQTYLKPERESWPTRLKTYIRNVVGV